MRVGVREGVTVAVRVGVGPDDVAVGVDVASTGVGVNVSVGNPGVREVVGVVGAPPLYVTRTATQSRKKSLEVELDTSITRTRKFASAKFPELQVRPQLSEALPRINVFMVVPRVVVDLAVVQVVPPSQESCTHITGELDVLSARASRRTSIPLIVAPVGIEKP